MGVPLKQAAKTLSKTDGNLNAALERPGLGDGNVEVVGEQTRHASGLE